MSLPFEIRPNRASAAAAGPIRLSVLVPFYGDDPSRLLTILAEDAPGAVELMAYDDGSPDPALAHSVAELFDGLSCPATALVCRVNAGRSAARNRLAHGARGEWLLFVDADMEVGPGFLAQWIDALAEQAADAVYGGYLPSDSDDPAHAVHQALARASDALDAAARRAKGAASVCSSNLAVRRSAFLDHPFDEAYSGWGWEDVDWALGFAMRFAIDHADIPARHGGLETVEALLSKFSRSGANFARLLNRHPDYASQKAARLAAILDRARAASAARLTGASIARCPFLPARIRASGLKLYRGGVNATGLSEARP